ncbi:hypothetical protein N7G274_008116 [Stereocaulon virgatum]|uniref:Homoaconitase, mitochondrial n=1 Tax=Stereocaulon virgatum TaxID=373712 RepID=A0ABR3ZZE8_9LECA
MLKRTGASVLRCRVSRPPSRQHLLYLHPRAYNTTAPRKHADVFPSQMENSSSSAILSSLQNPALLPQTLTEKIVQRYSLGVGEDQYIKAGDYVTLSPHYCMTHDNSWPTALKFMSIGASKIHDPRQIVMTLDHDVQNKSESNLRKYRQIEEFAGKQKVDFYPAGRGIGHQIMVEEGYAFPGTMTVASDSHANMYGGVGCLGTPMVRTDAACIWATGKTWWQVPPIAKVTFTGTLPTGVTGKDVIVALSGLFNNDEVLNHAIEFTGSKEAMMSLSVDARLTIANMTTEWGALTGLFPIDSVLETWLRYKATEAALYASAALSDGLAFRRFSHIRLEKLFQNPLVADPDAKYAKNLHLDLSTLSPYVSGPNSVKVATPLEELSVQNIAIDKAYLVSCTNSRASDLAAAAKVFKDAAKDNQGNVVKIAEGVKFYIAAASLPEQQAAEAEGDWQAMLDAGAIALPAGCGPCIGLGTGLLEDGEVGISASNRNFKGRMGSQKAKAYLASPEVVAASALYGKISGPGWYERPKGWSGVNMGEGIITAEEALQNVIGQFDSAIEAAEKGVSPEEINTTEEGAVEVLPGFPEVIKGEIVFLDADNISTDGIYPGKYTYQDDVTQEKMAEICMENYDSGFRSTARENDIVVAGFNFGCGSSREQAATSILAKKIPLVVAGSLGNTFSRNAINNALPLLQIPRLVQRLRQYFSSTQVHASQQNVKEPSLNRESLDSPPPAPQASPDQEKNLTRRTGWTLTWDVRRSKVVIQEGEAGTTWSEKVTALPPNIQEIIARGGLEEWVKKEIGANA